MSHTLEPERLDDLDDEAVLERVDPGAMLHQVATSAAQVREARTAAAEILADPRFGYFVAAGRPRAVVVAGMGGSGIAGDVLGAACGQGCPAPVLTVRGHRLPGWVGAADVVLAVSWSGVTEETLAAAGDALRRGCRLLAVGTPGSPLAVLAEQAGAPFVPVRSTARARSTMWALSVPLLVAVRALGLVDAPDEGFEAAARRLEDVSVRCGPSSESFANPAKELALELAGSVPMVWGASPLAGVAAYRFACQLAENAKYPGVFGELPEAAHNQVVSFDGPFGQSSEAGAQIEDFFRDRVEEPSGATRLRLVVLRDTEEHPRVAARAEAAVRLARERGVPFSSLSVEGHRPLERLAELIGVVDYATVYLALAYGIDPTPVAAIQELKDRVAE